MGMVSSSSIPPSPPPGWKCGRQGGLDSSMTQPRELEPSEANKQEKRRHASVPDTGLLDLPLAGSLQEGTYTLSGPSFTLLGPIWSVPWCIWCPCLKEQSLGPSQDIATGR